MTTWTVALPGVSKETKGVRIVWPVFFILSSIPLSSIEGQANAIRPNALPWLTIPPKKN